MRRICVVIIAFAATSLAAQPSPRGMSDKQVSDLNRLASLYKLRWETVFTAHGGAPLSNLDAASLLNHAEGPSVSWLKTYRTPAIDLLTRLSSFGNDRALFLNDREALPMRAFSWNGQVAVAVVGSIGTVYNADRLSYRQRAAAVTSANVIPVIQVVAEVFAAQGAPHVGVFVIYGTKGAEGTESDSEPEIVGLIAPMSLVSDLAAHRITDQDFVDQSAVLVCPSGDEREFLRVKVLLQ